MARRSSRSLKVKPIDLEAAVSEILREYAEAVTDTIAPSVIEVGEKVVEQLGKSGNYEDRTGEYRKSFRLKIIRTYRGTGGTIYSEDPHYRLTHLLERGHLTAGGTKRTRKFPHWKPAEKYAIEYFTSTLRKNIENVEV